MSETRDFPVAAIVTLTSRISLCEFSKVHEAAEYVMGHPIWTHQFSSQLPDIVRTILEQCPGLPTKLEGVTPDNYLDCVRDLEEQFGPMVKIRKGSGLTAMLPEDGIPDWLKHRTIFVNG